MYYCQVERDALVNERVGAAVGVAHAIAQCIGDRHALRKYRRALDPAHSAAGPADSDEMAEIRRRLRGIGVVEKQQPVGSVPWS